MASPQKENGAVQIANELLEKIIEFDYPSASPLKILMFIIRKTYGFNKKSDYISLTQIQLKTGLSIPTIVHWLDWLVKSLLVLKGESSQKGTVLAINKDYDQWVLKPLQVLKRSPPRYLNPFNTQKTIYTKDNIVDSPNGSSTVTSKPMNYEELNDGEVIYDSEDTPKKKDTFGRFPARISVEYCKLTGNNKASAHLKAGKELMRLALKEYPEDTQEQHFTEIVSRMKIAKIHYENLPTPIYEWSLGKIVEKWDKILSEWYQENLKLKK